MTENSTLGGLLREQMSLKAITATALSSMLAEAGKSVSASAIANYLNDDRKPRGGRLTAILDALEITGAHRLRAFHLADEPVPST